MPMKIWRTRSVLGKRTSDVLLVTFDNLILDTLFPLLGEREMEWAILTSKLVIIKFERDPFYKTEKVYTFLESHSQDCLRIHFCMEFFGSSHVPKSSNHKIDQCYRNSS